MLFFRHRKLEAIGTLAGGIAHDFNNLLMGIQGRASLMSIDLEMSRKNLDHCRAIETYVQSATNLTKQLLGITRGGKYDPQTDRYQPDNSQNLDNVRQDSKKPRHQQHPPSGSPGSKRRQAPARAGPAQHVRQRRTGNAQGRRTQSADYCRCHRPADS